MRFYCTCKMMDMSGSLLLLSLLTFSCGIFLTNAKSTGGRSCNIMDIPLQKNFDLKKFEGKWYAMLKTGMKDSLLSYFTEIYDGRVMFKTNLAGGYDIKAAGSKFYGGWCPKGKGYAVVKDEVAPEKMTMYFDTTIGRQIGMKPAWMLKTDYENYGVFYSCWKVLESGKCDPGSTYAFVVQRNASALNDQKLSEVRKALHSACVDFKDLTPVQHYGYCSGHDSL